MKKVLVRWVEMVTLEVPNECPTENVTEFEQWIYDHDKSLGHEPYSKNGTFTTEVATRDFEIVNVDPFETEEEARKRISENFETEAIWNTNELQRDFQVKGFLASYVVVVRKSDGKKGSLAFIHSPRLYFNFKEASDV